MILLILWLVSLLTVLLQVVHTGRRAVDRRDQGLPWTLDAFVTVFGVAAAIVIAAIMLVAR